MVVAFASALVTLMRRLVTLALVLMLTVSLTACGGNQARKPATISPENIGIITRQAEGFLASRNKLPELAELVNEKNWVFTRNLIHGPMQEVGRQMSYINRLLLPADRGEAEQRARQLKASLADLDEAARLQDGENLRKAYINVASNFARYAEIFPEEVQVALNQA